MPTVLRVGPYRFHFYSNEGAEPPHIHVRTSEGECKFWLDPILFAVNRGLPPHELRKIERIIYQRQQFLLQKYHEYHGA
jgi:hypothetical protein